MGQLDFDNGLLGDVPPIVNANEPHMACLFLVDTSGSMGDCVKDVNGEYIKDSNGEKMTAIGLLNDALNRFKGEVCKDDKTKDILDVAIVEFNNETKVVQEFTPIEMMPTVNLEAFGGTIIVPALEKAVDMVQARSRFYRTTGAEPYKPWIVLISDGLPFDSVDAISAEIGRLTEQNKLALWALSVPGADNALLHKLAGKRVLNLAGYDFSGFFNWVGKSMRAVSESAPGEKPKGQELPETITIDSLM